MTATYDFSLSTNKDWVRREIGDTDLDNVMLQDEEILAFIDDVDIDLASTRAAKYLAAAAALNALHVLWMARGRGHASKKVGRLSLVYGSGSGINVDAAIQAKITYLQTQGAILASPEPYLFNTY